MIRDSRAPKKKSRWLSKHAGRRLTRGSHCAMEHAAYKKRRTIRETPPIWREPGVAFLHGRFKSGAKNENTRRQQQRQPGRGGIDDENKKSRAALGRRAWRRAGPNRGETGLYAGSFYRREWPIGGRAQAVHQSVRVCRTIITLRTGRDARSSADQRRSPPFSNRVPRSYRFRDRQ